MTPTYRIAPSNRAQAFIESRLRKVEQARKRIDACGKDLRLEVDGVTAGVTRNPQSLIPD